MQTISVPTEKGEKMADWKFLIKLILCVIQLICLYQFFKKDRAWVIPIQLIVACVAMAI